MTSKPSNSESLAMEAEKVQIPGYTSIEHFTKEGFKTCVEAIRNANALPADRDLDFYKVSESFNNIITEEGNNVLRLMNKIMKCHDIEQNMKFKVLDEKTELVIEANDIILEKVGNNIDEMNGIRRLPAETVELQTVSAELPINGSWNRSSTSINASQNLSLASTSKTSSLIRLITAKNIVRPQKFFKDKIENSDRYPWEPRIKDKPNSLKPLAIFLEECDGRHEFSHPYEFELERFQPTGEQLKVETPDVPKPLAETELVEIDQAEQLDELVETLRQCKEFAVDVEHHSYRSFMGITCLLQISTKDKDYIIDTLALRDKLHILNEVFTKNSIVKIFHGSDCDVEWLQRDLSIYIVNLFDTHQAAKILEFSGLSLSYLLKRYCNVVADKQYQLADWRIRPLPEELKKYAREDTHYLIYIYQMMKKDLLKKTNGSDKLLRVVIDRSTEICKKRYFKPVLTPDTHLEIYRKCKKMFDNRQLYALRELFAWRDRIARDQDESYGYVLPNHMLLHIAESLPREMQGILACCSPIPPLVKSNLLDLHKIILKARDEPLEKAILKDDTFGRGILKSIFKANIDSPLHCPHDLSKMNEFRDDLPTLLSNKISNNFDRLKIEKNSTIYSVFELNNGKKECSKAKALKLSYLSPYERYCLVKPFVQAEEEKNNKEVEVVQADNRTDEERISSVRDHFLEMSKKFSEDVQLKMQQEKEQQKRVALIEMSGSRKRKREPSEADEYTEAVGNDNFTTPVPQFLRLSQDSKRKRQRDWFKNQRSSNKKTKKGPLNKKQKQQSNKNVKPETLNKKVKQEPSHIRFNQDAPDTIVKQEHPNVYKNQRQRERFSQQAKQLSQNQNIQVKREVVDNETNYGQSRSRQEQAHHHDNVPNRGRNNKQKRGKFDNPNPRNYSQQRPRENVEFTPYDYSSVDFRQFQGGAGSARGGAQLKSAFKPQNQRKMGNKNHRSTTFNNSRPSRGRGGGRGRGR